ncbi:MAG: DddA-like double-stranded DNA deaminase toxin [Micromonosporaceae bacterium]
MGGAAPTPAESQRVDARFDLKPYLDKLPVRRRKRGEPSPKTRGLWIDDNGDEHPLISGTHEPEFRAAQQHAEQIGVVRRPYQLTTAADVELKFAMRMRAAGISRANIVINNKPCTGEMSCDTLLPLFLPPNAELTVHGPDSFKKTYRGRPARQ